MKVFITGGTTGIGYELAKVFSNKGHEVGICGRHLTKLPADFKEKFPSIKSYTVNVLDKEELKKAIDEFSGDDLDMIIANAGIGTGDKSKIPDFELSRKVLEVNIFGVLNAMEIAMKMMIPKNKGQLVAVASVAGMVGLPGSSAYCASKAAVLKLCESYSIGLKGTGVSVTAIAPGFIDTPLTRKNKHGMPWLMPADKAALKIYNAIISKNPLFIFPWQMKIFIYILDRMPRFIYRFLMGLKVSDYTKMVKADS